MWNYLWLLIMVPVSSLFTGLGIYAMKRKKPMWFWSGKEVKEREIADIPAYNRANGIMWLVYSAFYWIDTVFGFFKMEAAGYFLIAVCLIGTPILPVVYQKIYARYKR